MASFKRLQKELADIKSAKADEIPENISVGPVNEHNLYFWMATIIGPKDTPYEGGIFRLSIKFPPEYPFVSPVVKFETKIFHCNILEKGDICLDILKGQWSPAYTIFKVLLSIVALLSDPNPNDPLNADAARLYKTNRKFYNSTVREYVLKYASC
jgi:ubiquitin-conjugating enzyme E2 D